jgi:hypothetical protein
MESRNKLANSVARPTDVARSYFDDENKKHSNPRNTSTLRGRQSAMHREMARSERVYQKFSSTALSCDVDPMESYCEPGGRCYSCKSGPDRDGTWLDASR